MRIREWKYNDGEFSYGQRIAIGEILQNEDKTWYQRIKECWKELYGWNVRLLIPILRVKMLDRMTEGIRYWVDVEEKTLKYEPTAEENKAGLAKLNAEVGHLGTVKALAEKFGVDPDIILGWQWGKVYGILFAELKESEYQRRLMDSAKK